MGASQAGSAHTQASRTLANIADSLIQHVQKLNENWTGTAAQSAAAAFQQLHETALGLAQASAQTGAVLTWLGYMILPFYKSYQAPGNGLVGDVQSLFGDNPQDKAAQQVMDRLNNRLVQANGNLPPSVTKNLPTSFALRITPPPPPATWAPAAPALAKAASGRAVAAGEVARRSRLARYGRTGRGGQPRRPQQRIAVHLAPGRFGPATRQWSLGWYLGRRAGGAGQPRRRPGHRRRAGPRGVFPVGGVPGGGLAGGGPGGLGEPVGAEGACGGGEGLVGDGVPLGDGVVIGPDGMIGTAGPGAGFGSAENLGLAQAERAGFAQAEGLGFGPDGFGPAAAGGVGESAAGTAGAEGAMAGEAAGPRDGRIPDGGWRRGRGQRAGAPPSVLDGRGRGHLGPAGGRGARADRRLTRPYCGGWPCPPRRRPPACACSPPQRGP